jgi:hypothetical protein
VVRAFQARGIKLLTCVRLALALAAIEYRVCYKVTFMIDHMRRSVLFAQKTRAINLAPSYHHAHRESTFVGAVSWRFEWDCTV